jgi:hypothetical protein
MEVCIMSETKIILLEQKVKEMQDSILGYFSVLAMLLEQFPEKTAEISNFQMVTFNPSVYMIEQTEDLMTGNLILKLKERENGE